MKTVATNNSERLLLSNSNPCVETIISRDGAEVSEVWKFDLPILKHHAIMYIRETKMVLSRAPSRLSIPTTIACMLVGCIIVVIKKSKVQRQQYVKFCNPL